MPLALFRASADQYRTAFGWLAKTENKDQCKDNPSACKMGFKCADKNDITDTMPYDCQSMCRVAQTFYVTHSLRHLRMQAQRGPTFSEKIVCVCVVCDFRSSRTLTARNVRFYV